MAIYKGTISGTGNAETRENEITPDGLAVVRNFECGYTDYQNTGGVVKDNGHDFDCKIISRDTVRITDGLCFAYGYFGGSEAVNFTFLPPAVEQYHIIYVELDRSVIPNACAVKIKNNQASANISVNTFRQDALSVIKTGVYQMPLWIVKVTNQGVQELTDLRKVRDKIHHVVNADTALHLDDNGVIDENAVVGSTPPVSDKSGRVATTAYVDRAVTIEINK